VAGYLLITRMTVTYTGARPPYPAYDHRSMTYKLSYSAAYNPRYDSFFWRRQRPRSSIASAHSANVYVIKGGS
jgi:hypothetical protein